MLSEDILPSVRRAFKVRRFGAFIVDAFLLGHLIDSLGLLAPFHAYLRLTPSSTAPLMHFTLAQIRGLPIIPTAIVVFAYFALFECLLYTTPGKLLFNLRILTVEGQQPSFTSMLIRNLTRPIEAWGSLVLIGAALASLSPMRQRLGDRLAKTVVVHTSGVPAKMLVAFSTNLRVGLLAGIIILGFVTIPSLATRLPLSQSITIDNKIEDSLPFGSPAIHNFNVPWTAQILGAWSIGQPTRSKNELHYNLAYMVHGFPPAATYWSKCTATLAMGRSEVWVGNWRPLFFESHCNGRTSDIILDNGFPATVQPNIYPLDLR